MSPRLLTLIGVAGTLNLTMFAARPLVTSGKLPAVQIGSKRAWHVKKAVFKHYIEEQYAATRGRIAEHSL